MIVAGAILLLKLAPLTTTSPYAILFSLNAALLTTLLSSAVAIAQTDTKRIIALSTSAHIALVLLSISLTIPMTGILHLLIHATSKAALFMTAGMIIHHHRNQQDYRTYGSILPLTQPTAYIVLTLTALGLAGLPFLPAFTTKDLILLSLLISPSLSLAYPILLTAYVCGYLYSLNISLSL